MSYTAQYDAANDLNSTLNKQIVVAIIKAAKDLINEDPSTNNHANRLAWAEKVSKHDAALSEGGKRVWAILTNATVIASLPNSLDSDVQFVVNGFINTWANEV